MINIRIEHTATGEKRFVHVSRSGRRYGGATAEEAERKALLATLHALKRAVGCEVAEEMCARLFKGVVSFSDLTLEQMRELKSVFTEAQNVGRKLEEMQRLEPMATEAQIKRIVKLGRYSIINDEYGNGFLWKKLPEWVVRYRGAKRVELRDLTHQEAWYVIRRLEQIEKRLLKGDSNA